MKTGFFFFFAVERVRGDISLWWCEGQSKSWGGGEKELTNLQAADKHRGEEKWRIREWQSGAWKEKQRVAEPADSLPDLKPERLNPKYKSPSEDWPTTPRWTKSHT